MRRSIKRRLTIRFSWLVGLMMLAVLVLIIFSMSIIRNNVSDNEAEMGRSAAENSVELLMEQALISGETYVDKTADVINEKISNYEKVLESLAISASDIYENPENYAPVDTVQKPAIQVELGNVDGNVMNWIPFDAARDTIENQIECQRLGYLYNILNSNLELYPEITLFYIVSKNGYTVGIDDSVALRSSVEYYDASEVEYFTRPLIRGESYISSIYEDQFGKGILITMSVPIIVNDEIIGVFAADILADDLRNVALDSSVEDISGAMLFEKDGTVIAHTDGLSEQFITEASKALSVTKSGTKGDVAITEDEKSSYLIHSPVEKADWILGAVLSQEQIVAPAEEAEKTITELTNAMLLDLDDIISMTEISIIVLLLLTLFIIIVVVRRVSNSISEPLVELSNELENVGIGNLDFTNKVDTGDEIQVLGESFEKMTVSLKKYINNLTEVTAEKERIGAELNVATGIQAGMLPSIFPAFPDRTDMDIYASMRPAKEVGGDFYDFFFADEKHVALVVADVSGKGVPAALFMVIAKTLIKNYAQLKLSPSEVFTRANDQLCEGNDGAMFVTGFMGIINLETGEFTYVNAGHNLPYIRKSNGDFEVLEAPAGFVLAGLEGIPYVQKTTKFEKGDMIYMFTDGVTEAINTSEEMFEEKRLVEVLNKNKDKSLKEILDNVNSDLDKFVGEAPQFDDITMLIFKYFGQ